MENLQIPFQLDSANPALEQLRLQDAEMGIFPHFLSSAEADHCLRLLLEQTPWQQDSLNFGGKIIPIPRLQAWVGDKYTYYGYSGLSLTPLPWTPLLEKLRTQVESICDTAFNSVLLNYYRDGKDSVAWHSDDEKELGKDPLIASLSLGASRRFELKHRTQKTLKSQCELTHGSLLFMGKGVQQHWQHQVPKQPAIDSARINLTFRQIKTGF